MEKEFIPYEQALALKELGFDEPCFGYYYTLNGKDWKFAEKSEYYRLDDEINIGGKFSLLAPTYSQAFRWFREKYEYYYHIFPLQITASDKTGYRYSWEIYNHTPEWITEDRSLLGSLTYEEAELACLRKLIEIVKK
jgi:hypothetical protein